MDAKKMKLLKNTIIFLVGNIGSKLIQFFLVPLYTYTMVASEFGTADLILTAINFLMPIFSLQLSDGLLRFGLDSKVKKEDAYNSTFKILMICTIISILLSPILVMFKSLKDFIFFFILILNLRIYRDILSIILKIEDKNKIFSIDSIIYSLVLSLSAILFLSIFKLGINGYFLSYVVANIVSIIFILSKLKPKFRIKKKVDKNLTKQLIIYSLPMIINSLSYWITMASDKFMINIFLTTSAVGIYAIATKIPTIITTLTGIFNQAWMLSSISEYENDRDINFYNETLEFYCSTSFIVCSIIILFIKPFMSIYVSPEYYIAWKYSGVLIVSAIFSGISAFLNGIFYAYKRNISATVTTLIGAIINIVFNLLFIPKYGIMGASVATLISWFAITIVRLIFIKRIVGLEVKWYRLAGLCIVICCELLCLNALNGIMAIIINIALTLVILFIERRNIVVLTKEINNKIKFSKKIKVFIRHIIGIDKKYRRKIKNDNFTILCQNCTGGLIYHFLAKQFLTPTINVYFTAKDFIKFCENLDYYIKCKPKEENTQLDCPVMKLDDVMVYGVHYKDFNELLYKWEERKKRINKENLFIIMTERDGCEYEDLLKFDKLDYKNKIIFTHKKYEEIKSSYYVKGTENKGKDREYHHTKSLTDFKSKISPFRYIDDFNFVEWLNRGGK